LAWKRTSIVADNDSIRIEHGDNFEHEVVPQILGSFVVTHQILQGPVHDVGCIWLARMHSRSQHNGSTKSNFLRTRDEVSDNNHFTVVLSNGLAQNGLSDFIFGFRSAYRVQEFTAVTVSVGVAMCEVDLVIFIFKCALECEGVIESTSLLLHAALVVTNTHAVTGPTYLLLLRTLHWIYQRLHTLIVGTLRFDQINDIELVDSIFPGIAHFEEEPLGVIARRIVVLQDQVILKLAHLHCSPQIPTLKSTFKHQSCVPYSLQLVVRFESAVVSINFDASLVNIGLKSEPLQIGTIGVFSEVGRALFIGG
jgi:hypothetical protein